MVSYVSSIHNPVLFQLKNMKKVQEATIAATKRETEMTRIERYENEPVNKHIQHKRENSGEPLTEITTDGQDETAASQSVTATCDDVVDGGDSIDVTVEPPRMTKLKVKPVCESDSVELDVVKQGEGSEDVCDAVEQIGDTQGKHDREEGKDMAGDREETVRDRGDKETGVTEYLADGMSTGPVDTDVQHEAGKTCLSHFIEIIVSLRHYYVSQLCHVSYVYMFVKK